MHIIFDTPHQIEIYSVSHHIYSLVITFFFYFVYEHSWPILQKTLLFLGTLFYGYDRCRLKVHENVWIKFPSIYIGGWKVCIYLPWSFHYVICKTVTPTHLPTYSCLHDGFLYENSYYTSFQELYWWIG